MPALPGLLLLLLLLLLLALLASPAIPARQAEWKPATAPLMTRWAKEVAPERVLPEYPRPQLVRRDWLNLNGVWQFSPATANEPAPTGRDLPERILVPFPVESALSGVMKPAERVWYRRTFTVPETWRGRRTILQFGAVDWEATVHVNGRRLGEHRGGYDPFSFDVTEALRPEGPQELVVGVFDPSDRGDQPRGKQVLKPEGIYYTPSTGIWQTVWLEPVAADHVADLQLAPDVARNRLRLRVTAVGDARDCTVDADASEGQREVGRAEGKPGEWIDLPIPRPRLWSPTDPFLYDLKVRLRRQGVRTDSIDSYFGMRTITLGNEAGANRLLLNGKPLFQMGILDQGFWPDGLYTAPTDAALRYDLEQERRLGFNMVRKHVKVEPRRWYYWADRMGLLVWQDMPSGNNKTPESRRQFELELRRMIENLRNHPSVVMWVVFNEGWGQYDTERLTRWVEEFDSDRLVNNASGWTDTKVGDVIDVHNYPNPRSPAPEAARAAVLGEFGGLGLGVDGHTWTNKNWAYQGTTSSDHLTSRYEALLRRVWGFQEKPGLSAAVYTQTTDVETEINGLLTYDRAVMKVDVLRISAANRGQLPRLATVVPPAPEQAATWRYTTNRPAEGWFRPEFDAAGWQEGPSGFGTRGTPGAVVRTVWNTPEIWLRREITLPGRLPEELRFSVHHDEDVRIYVNGVLAAEATGYTTDYDELPLTPEGRRALRPGRNLVAVHCKQTGGGQYIDLGVVRLDRAPGGR